MNDYTMRRTSRFQQRVYEEVSRVPSGRVTTYKAIAESIGCGSAQAVGQALKRNPSAPIVPCHRVITSQLNIGGYLGDTRGTSIERKLRLLNGEGVTFDDGGQLIDPTLVWSCTNTSPSP